jgi:hypothetical protein
MRFWSWKPFPWKQFQGNGFQSSLCRWTCAIRSELLQYLYLLIHRTHVSGKPKVCPSEGSRPSPVSPCFHEALVSWAIPPTGAYGLVACSSPLQRRAIDGLLRSEYPFCVTLGWCFTPMSIRVDTKHQGSVWSGHNLLLGLPTRTRVSYGCQPFGRVCLTTLPLHLRFRYP